MRGRVWVGVFGSIGGVLLWASAANATPILQLYLEGATYDTATETWLLAPPGSSGGAPFRLWAIGNVAGSGGKGTIFDVKLSAVYDTAVGPLTFTITPSTTGGFNGFTDPSTPSVPTFLQIVSDGSAPLLGDGSTLPSHGEYGPGRTWQEFALGDFSLTDSPLTDFNGTTGTPVPTNSSGAQINVYEISVAPGPGSSDFGVHPFEIHFDLYNHVEGKTHSKYVFAPFSHDAGGEPGTDATVTIIPEPGSALLFCTGGIGLSLLRRRRAPQPG